MSIAAPPRPLPTASTSLPNPPTLPSTMSPSRSPSLPTTPKKLGFPDITHMLVKLRSPSQTVIVSSSGPEPLTHPTLRGRAGTERAEHALVHVEHFVCADAVEPAVLLRASRTVLLDQAKAYGADSLVDEMWTLSIRPKSATYRVSIKYSAHPAISGAVDPRRPIALRQAQGIPGVMTIIERL